MRLRFSAGRGTVRALIRRNCRRDQRQLHVGASMRGAVKVKVLKGESDSLLRIRASFRRLEFPHQFWLSSPAPDGRVENNRLGSSVSTCQSLTVPDGHGIRRFRLNAELLPRSAFTCFPSPCHRSHIVLGRDHVEFWCSAQFGGLIDGSSRMSPSLLLLYADRAVSGTHAPMWPFYFWTF